MGRSAKNLLDTACCGREVGDLQHLADMGPIGAKGGFVFACFVL